MSQLPLTKGLLSQTSSSGGICVSPGQVCLFRSGLVGAVMKLPCCPGSTCTLLQTSFNCVLDK